MKALNILSVLFFLLVATACSSESDTIMNDIDKEVETASEVYASFGVSLAASDIQTRAGEETEAANKNESTVKNCYIAVFDNKGKLLGAKLYSEADIEGTDGKYTLGKNIVFKVSAKDTEAERPDLTVVAVANMNPNDLTYGSRSSITGIQNCSSYNDLMNFQLLEDPNVLVKVGECTIKSAEYSKYMNISSSMFPDENPDITSIKIEVKQRSAAIELNTLDIMSDLGDVSEIKVKAIQLKNMVYSTKVGEYVDGDSYICQSAEVKAEENGTLLKHRLCTYGNKMNTKTALYFEYSYVLAGKEETGKCEFTIKTPVEGGSDVEQVEANHLYKLNVKITNGVATATIQCSTKDWNEGETIVIPVKENK